MRDGVPAVMRRISWPLVRVTAVVGAVVGAVLVAAACANVTPPPGGPPDAEAPIVLAVTPDSGAIVGKPKEVRVQFDEVISETPRGAQNLAELVFISPRSGTPEVSWNRTSITIKPSKGWKENTVYSVIVNPGIVDLRSNVLDSAIRTVFSTGGPIPETGLSGAAFDWTLGRPAPRALVEALAIDSAARDTTFYQALADSSGRFVLRYLPPGPYLLRAILDRNSNRTLEPLESWDTVRVTVAADVVNDLYAFVHDTVGLRISDFSIADSGRTLRVAFDKPYAPDETWTPERIRIAAADSMPLQVLRVTTPPIRAAADSAQRKAVTDSIARSNADTSVAGRARADTIARKRAADSVANAERDLREQRRLAILRGERPVQRDTTPPPKFNRPLVYNEIFVELAEPLPDATRLRVEIRDVRSLSGVIKSPNREVTTPKPPPLPDSSKTPRPAPPRRDTLPARATPPRRDTLPRLR